MAKKAYNNYDDTLFGQYIRQIENADSAGWNASDRIWRAPQRKGLDKRNRGMGVDVLNNLDTKALTKNRPGQYLTEKEEHQLRNAHIQYLLDVINRRKEEDNPALKNMSPKKQAQVLGIMYRGDAPELWKENTILGKALISDKDEDMDKAIKDFYESKGLGERAKNDSIFWNNQKMQNKPKAASVPQTHINNTVEYQDAIKTYRPAIIPSQTKRDTKKAMQDKVDFHNFMDAISIQNNLPPAYTSKFNIHSEGGFMHKPRDAWEALPLSEKAEMMKVAVKNGITNLQDIRDKYNEFAEGGNIYKEGGKKKSSSANPSAQRAMRYFMDKGLTDYQAAGLVGNLMRESEMNPQALNKGSKAYGLAQWLGPRKKALFARYGNNPTLENQLDFIWSELNSTHKNGLRHLRSSRSAEEAARNAMGYYEFSAGPEAAIANMRKYGQDGEGSMRKGISFASNLMGQPIPAYNPRQNETVQLSLQESAVPSEGFIYTPLNPQVFGIADTPSYTINVPDQTLASEPQVDESSVSLYSPEELDRQERMDKLSAFNNMLRMTSPQGNGNVFLDTIGMLTGNAFANGGGIHIKPSKKGTFTAAASKHGMGVQEFASKVLTHKDDYSPAMVKKANFARNASKWHGLGGNLFDGTSEDSQQMVNPYKPNGGFYYINPEGQPVNPTTRDIIELPDVVVAADKNSPSWYNRTTVGDRNDDGSRNTWEGIQPLVMSSSEWDRSHSANDLQTTDPYGEIPWNAAAVATGFLAPQLLTSKMYNYSNKAIDAVKGYYLAHTPMKPVNAIETTTLKPVVETVPSKNSLLDTSAKNVFQIKDALDKQGQVYTDNIIEYLGKYKDNHNLGEFSSRRQEYANLLKKWGADISKLSDGDLKTLMDDRAFNVSQYTPEGNYFIVTSENYPSFNKVKATGKNRNKTIGEINAVKDKDDDYFRVAGIHVDSNAEGGFGEGAYNSLIDYAHQVGLKGVRSGDHLQSPEKTTSTWKHYKNKVKLGTDGRHEYGTGRGITGKQHVDLNGDIYLLKENSGRILPPFKSADYVHPSLISNGRMLPPNWNIRDAFKIGIPSIGILNTLDLK